MPPDMRGGARARTREALLRVNGMRGSAGARALTREVRGELTMSLG